MPSAFSPIKYAWTGPQHGQSRRSVSATRRLRLEPLEDRHLLAVIAPSVFGDTGPGSLREAILRANADASPDVIELRPGTYTLSIANTAGQENLAAQGDLDITQPVTIRGMGAVPGATVIDARGIDRVFQVFEGATVVFENLTIQGGLAKDNGEAGVRMGETAACGGGILNGAGVDPSSGTGDPGGEIVLDGVFVQRNTARGADRPVGNAGGSNAAGGGIYSNDSLEVLSSRIRNNAAEGGEGGDTAAGGAAWGGGVYSAGALYFFESRIAYNEALGGAGGNGVAAGAGGAGGDADGGGIFALREGDEPWVLEASWVFRNQAAGGRGGEGGNGVAGGSGGGGDGQCEAEGQRLERFHAGLLPRSRIVPAGRRGAITLVSAPAAGQYETGTIRERRPRDRVGDRPENALGGTSTP
ncbi:MAG: hypothetical protein HUU20_23305 [Pirellulales bacterium]|nr:hypothetical protein [Pirellulales bacterium]